MAFAGPFSNLVMASLVAIPLRAIDVLHVAVPPLIAQILLYLVLFNIVLFVFNLLPIPPLDGYKILLALVSPRLAWQIRPYEQYGFLILLLLFFTGAFGILGRLIIVPIFNLLVGGL